MFWVVFVNGEDLAFQFGHQVHGFFDGAASGDSLVFNGHTVLNFHREFRLKVVRCVDELLFEIELNVRTSVSLTISFFSSSFLSFYISTPKRNEDGKHGEKSSRRNPDMYQRNKHTFFLYLNKFTTPLLVHCVL